MDESYCALCGVCFGVYAELYHNRVQAEDVAWTEYFLALRRRQESPDVVGNKSAFSYFLSGVGSDLGREGCVPPPTHNNRKLDDDDAERVDDGDLVVAYADRGTGREVVYPMHPACWDIFLQNHALLARENASTPNLDILADVFSKQELEEGARGMVPDWTYDYEGAEEFWADGWAYHEEPEASEVAGVLDWSSEWDYLVHDPNAKEGFGELLANPPLVRADELPRPLTSNSNGSDFFQHFPEEILLNVLCFLPTPSVRAVRLASRRMAAVGLGYTYWHSRFSFPNELSHVLLPPSMKTCQNDGHAIDWKILCERLLRPSGQQNLGCQNRRRISRLTRALARNILSKDNAEVIQDRKLESKNNLVCRQSISCPGQESLHNSTATFDQTSPSKAVNSVSVSFRSIRLRSLLTGISMSGKGWTAKLGRCDDDRPTSFTINPGVDVSELYVALIAEGIVGIKFVINGKDGQGKARNHCFGHFEDGLAQARLTPSIGPISGFDVGSTKDGRIVKISLLEKPLSSDRIPALDSIPIPQNYLWYPAPPPLSMIVTPPVGCKHENVFSYMQQTIFAEDEDALNHLAQVSAFLDLEPKGVHAFQFHFNNRDPTALPNQRQGKDLPFLVDGPGGEKICGIEVLWSEEEKCAGIILITNQARRGVFATADVSRNLQIERIIPPPGTFIGGIYGEVTIRGQRCGAYQNFGLLCVRGTSSSSSLFGAPAQDVRRFDDHLNLWTLEAPPRDYMLGEVIGSQSNHGFINWIEFQTPVKRITACLGCRKRNRDQTTDSDLVGLKFDFTDSTSAQLGRCTSLGPHFEIGDGDFIFEVAIGLAILRESSLIEEVIFTTKRGISRGFRGTNLLSSSSEPEKTRLLRSGRNLELVGMTWCFDLGPEYSGDHGIQPLYRATTKGNQLDVQGILYPSMKWTLPPPANLQLRPIHRMKPNDFPLTSSLSSSDDPEKFSDFNLVSIRVFFNAFLQGIVLEYKTGEKRVLGNQVGVEQAFSLQGERIFAIWLHERVQTLFQMSLPRDIICVDGIRFGMIKWVEGQHRARISHCFGCAQPFGPFINNQRGLWNPEGGGSAEWLSCFKSQTSEIYLEPGTSFMGLYAESASTFVRRIGVLVSDRHPLPDDVSAIRDLRPSSTENTTILDVIESDPVPWLGPSPPEGTTFLPVAGHKQGTYRLWCPAVSQISKVVIYRHRSWNRLVVVGLEFFHQVETDSSSTLLGFRSLWMDHAVQVDLDGKSRTVGFAVKSHHEAGHPGLETIKIITSKQEIASAKEEFKNDMIVMSDDPSRIVGFFAYVDEFIQGIGIIQQ